MKTKPLCYYPRFRHVDHLVLRLWTKAVGTPDYDKAEWQRLQAAVERLAVDGLGEPQEDLCP